MGEFLRSRSMELIHLVIPFDVARDTVDELGRLGVVQFRDVCVFFFFCFFFFFSSFLQFSQFSILPLDESPPFSPSKVLC